MLSKVDRTLSKDDHTLSKVDRTLSKDDRTLSKDDRTKQKTIVRELRNHWNMKMLEKLQLMNFQVLFSFFLGLYKS